MRCIASAVLCLLTLGLTEARAGWLTHPSVRIVASSVTGGGEVYVAGYVFEPVVPTTADSVQSAFLCAGVAGCTNGFVARLSANGRGTVWATYLGRTGTERLTAMVPSADGDVYVSGFETSSGSAQSYLLRMAGLNGAVRARMDLRDRVASALAIDGTGVYAVGTAWDAIAPTPGAYASSSRGNGDAFAMKVDLALRTVLYIALLGTTALDQARTAAVDRSGALYVGGSTGEGQTFPATPGALFRHGFAEDVFVTKLSPSGGAIEWSAVFGDGSNGAPWAIAVEPDAVHVAGGGLFQLVPEAVTTLNSFYLALAPDGSRILRSHRIPGPYPSGGNERFRILPLAGGETIVTGPFQGRASTTRNALNPCGETGDFYVRLRSNALVYGDVFDAVLGADGSGTVWAASKRDDVVFEVIDLRSQAAQVTCVADGATFRARELAPGEIVTLFGPNIGPQDASVPGLDVEGKFPQWHAETAVFFDGISAPLLYVSRDQINAVVPFAMAGRQQVSVVVQRGESFLPAVYRPSVPAAPAIFGVLNQDGTLNSAARRASANSVVSVYLTGAGVMAPMPAEGAVGTGTTTVAGSVKADARAVSSSPFRPGPSYPAEVLYAGDAPGLVQGLVQMNIRIPAELRGSAILTVVIEGRTAETYVYLVEP